METLQENDVPQMTWVPGTALPVPDALSRRRDYEESCPSALEGLGKFLSSEDMDEQIPGLSGTHGTMSWGQSAE